MTRTEPQRDTRVLVDPFGRTLTYLRIAVTDRCNLRCVYCMPEKGVEFTPNERLLTNPEIERAIRIAANLGVTKIRFTGGEPLLRKGIVDLIRSATDTPGIDSVHMTTNGIRFAESASDFKAAGLRGINVSLDTLDPDKFKRITRRTGVENVLASLDAAFEVGLESVKLNVVAMRGFNDDEIADFVALTKDRPLTVRFIELMPFDAHQIWKTGRFFGADWILEQLAQHVGHLGDTTGSKTEHHVFRVAGHAGKVAVIPAYTRSLCGACNRLRLTADGVIRNCLYGETEFSVRDALRSGDEAAVVNVFRDAVSRKAKDGWAAQRAGKNDPHLRTSMTQIGG